MHSTANPGSVRQGQHAREGSPDAGRLGQFSPWEYCAAGRRPRRAGTITLKSIHCAVQIDLRAKVRDSLQRRLHAMFGLRYLFYPWGLVVQIVAIVHFMRRRPEPYWFFIIIFGGLLGAAAYIVAEVLPDVTLLRDVFQGFGRKSRAKTLETQILDNPSAANYEELGEIYKDDRQYAKAREAFNHAIAARSDSPHTFYLRGQCSLALNDFAAAIADLVPVVSADRKFDYYRAAGLLADAYAKTGELDAAGSLYGEVTEFSTTPETLYNYANYLRMSNRPEQAREWAQKLLAKKRTLPRYMERIERSWFRKGKALMKELATA
jgi:hypothetical protein